MSNVKSDYENIASRLLETYSRQLVGKAIKTTQSNQLQKAFFKLNNSDQTFLRQILSMADLTDKYNNQSDCDKALEVIDLSKIYKGVEDREKENTTEALEYEDFLVKELLAYFKNDFFKWVTKPKCPQCHLSGDNIISIGSSQPPSNNAHKISRIENYRCTTCNERVDFPRYNSAVKLLETREGRCGEWVNCFLLILKAVLGADSKLRYVWNYEDHVWCEYYSPGLKKWIHLDPCENVFDEPTLYCKSWGKRMSFVFGFGDGYIADLSSKYITKEKQIKQSNIFSRTRNIQVFIDLINYQKLVKYYANNLAGEPEKEKLTKLYNDVILIKNQEKLSHESAVSSERPNKTTLPQGRQTGGPEWTKARGEDGTN